MNRKMYRSVCVSVYTKEDYCLRWTCAIDSCMTYDFNIKTSKPDIWILYKIASLTLLFLIYYMSIIDALNCSACTQYAYWQKVNVDEWSKDESMPARLGQNFLCWYWENWHDREEDLKERKHINLSRQQPQPVQ